MRRIVLDTNCLIQMLSKRSPYYVAWKAYQEEKFALCISNDILTEYREMKDLQNKKYSVYLQYYPLRVICVW